MTDKNDPLAARPTPRNVARQPWAGLRACWVLTVSLHENGQASATFGKLDLASRRMRFSQLSSSTWEGPVSVAAADIMLEAAEEVRVDTAEQLALF